MLVLHYECHKKWRLPDSLWTEIQEKCLFSSLPPPPPKEMIPLAFPPWFVSGWMKKGRMAAPFMQGGRRQVLQLCLYSPGRQLGHSSKMQDSSIEFFLCCSGPEHIPLTSVPCLPCQEHFGGDEFWVPAAKITEMLISWGSQAEVMPSSPVPDDAHLEGRLWISKKCCRQSPDCSRGAICPCHCLVPLIEPHILFLAPSVWWLWINWQDILTQLTLCIQ